MGFVCSSGIQWSNDNKCLQIYHLLRTPLNAVGRCRKQSWALSENEQVFFDAIKASESRVLSEKQEVKGDIKTMKSEIRYVKNECMKTKEEVEIVKQKHLGCEKHIRSMYKDIKNI